MSMLGDAIISIFILTTVAFTAAVFIMPLCIRTLVRLKMGKQLRDPREAPIFFELHKRKAGTPTMGGIAVWGTTIFLALLFFIFANTVDFAFLRNLNFLSRGQTLLPLGVLMASAVVGLVDDYFNVRRRGAHGGGLDVRHRLLVYTAIAAMGAWWFYFKLDWTTLRVPFIGAFDIGAWYIPIFIFIIVATAFSVNESDGLDGLAGGLLLAAFAAYGAIAFSQERYHLAALCGVIVGALLAFLWYNINPAQIFMGDTGAMSLGITLGVVALLTNTALLLPIIGLPFVIESASVIVQFVSKKLRHGKKIFSSTPIHHHLEARAWTEPQIVMRFWMIAGVCATVGVVLALVDIGRG